MTKLLKQAFEKASELPDSLQDELALELLREMEGETRWDKSLAESHDVLDSLAEKAVDQHKKGRTKQMGPDEL